MTEVKPNLMDALTVSRVDKVVLTRHQKTDYTSSDTEEEKERLLSYVLGEVDPPLSEEGRKGAEASRPALVKQVGESLPGQLLVGVSSSLNRAKETLKILSPWARRCPDSRLGPPDYNAIPIAIRAWVHGELSLLGTRRAWLRSGDFPIRLRMVSGAVQAFLCHHKATRVVVVGHSETVDLLTCILTGVSPYRFVEPQFHAETGELVVLERDPDDKVHQYFSITSQ